MAWLGSVRGRLALWHAAALAVTVLTLYVAGETVLRRRLERRVDLDLVAAVHAVAVELRAERDEGEPAATAAASVAQEALTARQGVAVFDAQGQLLAQRPLPDVDLPLAGGAPSSREVALSTRTVGASRRVRVATRTIDLDGGYRVVVFESMDDVDRDLALARRSALVVLPLACALTALAGWVVAGRTLRPVISMSRDVRALDAADLQQRIVVPNPGDELGHLAQTFNELLARLQTAFERQRQFMADASHELRTPVSIVRTAATMTLQRQERSETEYREALELIGGQAERTSRLVDDLFLLARADAGEYPVRLKTVDLGEMALDCVASMRVLARGRGIAVKTGKDLAVADAPCLADEDLLRRMLVNLVENAIEHTPDQGEVEVGLAVEDGGYALSVTDGGDGVPLEDRGRVFERFYRGAGETNASRNGAGLGLAISRWIAEAHGGHLKLADGPGCTFVAWLPGGSAA